jgi:hypothetical protein
MELVSWEDEIVKWILTAYDNIHSEHFTITIQSVNIYNTVTKETKVSVEPYSRFESSFGLWRRVVLW